VASARAQARLDTRPDALKSPLAMEWTGASRTCEAAGGQVAEAALHRERLPAGRASGFKAVPNRADATRTRSRKYNRWVIYEWDPAKAAANERKHGVSFDEAKTVYLDSLAETFDDPDHSQDERRFITIGMSAQQRLLFVAHADSGGERIRIISARTATRGEANAYQERSAKRP
jgi:uncharacterized DUF497 family protein